MSDEIKTVNDVQDEQKVKEKTRLDEPKLYKVIMHNDHYTTMDFVVEVLMSVFDKQTADATKIMLDIHNKGKGICGVFTFDIAVSKISIVHDMAKKAEFPLKCSYEEA